MIQQSNLEEAQGATDFDLLREELKGMRSTKSSLEEDMAALDANLTQCQKTAQIQYVEAYKLHLNLSRSNRVKK